MTYELNPRGGTEAINASTCLEVSFGDLPRYALTYSFLILSVMSERGRICDTTSFPDASFTITFSDDT